ncbi:hypothetical protein GGF49_001733 [Coemansia sp. RSA 1853]|nr:hypothetical protein GGF49_001733 [Coemansia sp. RSA 1853]
MSTSTRALGASRSVYSRIRAITKQNPSPLTQHIRDGRSSTKRTKRTISRKVAWRHACPTFTPYPTLLDQALRQSSISRIHLVLSRMLTEHARNKLSTHVSPELLRTCAEYLLHRMLDDPNDTVLEATQYLCEIEWWTRKNEHEVWTVVRAVACDLRGDRDLAKRYVEALGSDWWVCDLAIKVLQSQTVSLDLVNWMFKRLEQVARTDVRLATVFYCAAMPRHLYDAVPAEFTATLVAHRKTILQTPNAKRPHNNIHRAQSLIALAHAYLAHNNMDQLDRCLLLFALHTDAAHWPMRALALSVQKLVSLHQTEAACQLLQASARRDHRAFVQCMGTHAELNIPQVKLAMLQDELSFRLHHHCQPTATDLPSMTAFFVPLLETRITDPGIKSAVTEYYTQMADALETAQPQHMSDLVSEAASWSFRLQSIEPIVLLTHHITTSARKLSNDECSSLLIAYVRALRCFHMMHYTARILQPPTSYRWTRHAIPSLAMPTTSDSKGQTWYTDCMSTLRATRTALCTELLRRGIEPPHDALLTIHSHFACTGHKETHALAARLLPLVPPSLTSIHAPFHMVVQAYYEHTLLSLALQPRRLTTLFEHILTHHNVDSHAFRRRIVDQTVYMYIRHEHFVNWGWFRLERPFIRIVDRPRFSTTYLNMVRPRFWALHVFLRNRKYVPRLRLHNKQLRIHKLDLYTMGVTAIPSSAKMQAQKIDMSIDPVQTEDIYTALNIFFNSTPRNKLGADKWSAEWMLKHQTKMIVSE